ncbi:exonuclease V-like [Mytilus californianus]|uniref:exonuclease V-like n=1 Tax=Mytilus californianus TaxID=6549 RepID=UPI002247681C|nr:exonuclease V-like [Mytilus californianus]
MSCAPNSNKEIDFDDEDDDLLLKSVNECEADITKNSTKSQLSLASGDGQIVPLQKFRHGYLWVSDLSSQSWCEQQMFYKFTVPGVIEENPAMTKGTDLHLARELAAHDIVQVQVTSNEDIWAIKVLNLLTAINAFQFGQTIAREVPIFGVPFKEEDIFVVGLIDELRFDPENYTIDLSELKTRTSRMNPSKAVTKQHKIQVMLYKRLFDNLVKGTLSKNSLATHLRLDLNKQFGDQIVKHLEEKAIINKNLNDLMDHVFGKMQSLTCINQLHVEYVYQDTSETLSHVTHPYDEGEIKTLYLDYLKFWKGERSPTGVDIEEAWKCQRCDFEPICEWRRKKSEECAQRNIQNNHLY